MQDPGVSSSDLLVTAPSVNLPKKHTIMPGLQSLVSAWTRINHDHLKYAHEGPPRGGGGEEKQPQNDAATYAITPQPSSSLPSSSSLSTYSLPKTYAGVRSWEGTAEANSLAATPPTGSSASAAAAAASAPHSLAPPSQISPLYHHGQPPPQLSSTRYTAPLLDARRGSSLAASQAPRPSRPSPHHPPPPREHGRRSSHHLHRPLDLGPPPRAGAGAILSRRPRSAMMTDTSPSTHNAPSPSASTDPGPAKKGSALKKSPSTSLWHSLSSTRSTRSSSNHSVTSATASLDDTKSGPPTTADKATVAESHATEGHAPQSSNHRSARAAARNSTRRTAHRPLTRSDSTIVSLLSEPDTERHADRSNSTWANHDPQSAVHPGRNHTVSGLHDSLIRNGPPGENWRQDNWFPASGQPLPSNTESSGSSSGTALNHNRSLASQARTPNYHNATSTTSAEEQPPPPTTVTARTNKNSAAMLPSNQPHCDRCSQMESTLLSLHTDLEYLRTVELQREFACKNCDGGGVLSARVESVDSFLPSSATSTGSRGSHASPWPPRQKSGGGHGSTGSRPRTHAAGSHRSLASRTGTCLREASQRLSDLSTRHRRQVKQATHERAYWQNEMHLKLEKFSMMCKNLNREAALRADEAHATRAQLEGMTSERNALAGQVDTLKARVELYEDEGVAQSVLREEWRQEKTGWLDSMERALRERDEALGDLSSRLERAVDTIENERTQHLARRQVIFPSPSRTSPSPHSKFDRSPKVDDLEPIHQSKEAARKAQMVLQGAMAQSADRQKDMQSRLDAMERELAEARAMLADGNHRQEVPAASEVEGRGVSI